MFPHVFMIGTDRANYSEEEQTMEYKMSNSEIKNESNMNASGGVAKWLMAVMPGRAWSVVLSLAALTTMGLEFLWRCPDAGFLSEQLGEIGRAHV